MTSDRKDSDRPAGADGEGRGLLRGLPRDSDGPGTAPPAALPAAADDPGPRTAAEGSSAGLRRIEAKLGEMTAVLAAVREFGSHLAELKRTIESASAWSSSIRAINDKLQQAVGSDLRAVEAGRLDLGKVVAALKLREEGLKEQHEAIDKGVDALRALWKSADQRLKELTSKTQALADRYEAFTTESKAHRTAIAALSRDLRDGGADLRESVTKNRQAQFAILERTLGNVREFKEQNDGFLERLDESGEALLEAIRREWTATRRWAVPALAAALVLAVPSFAVVGAYAQSEFRIFRPYDETRGWRQGVWESHGETVKNCMLESLRTKRVVRCGFDVEYF